VPSSNLHTRVALPDVHIPFHHQRLLRFWLDFVERTKPDGVDILGDLIDCYTISRFDKNPARRHTLRQEIEQARLFLAMLWQRVPDAEIRYSEGNHEDRLRKYLWRKANDLADLEGLTIPELLHLDELNISWHTGRFPYRVGDVIYQHGNRIRKSAGHTAEAISQEAEHTVICGHSHRQGFIPHVTRRGYRAGYEGGCLCDADQIDYLDSVPNWQLGWPVVHFFPTPDEDLGHHSVEFVRVVDDSIIYRDEIIGRVSELQPLSLSPKEDAKQHTCRPCPPEGGRATPAPLPPVGVVGTAGAALLTVEDLMRIFCIGRRTVWARIKKGLIPPPTSRWGRYGRAVWTEGVLDESVRRAPREGYDVNIKVTDQNDEATRV